QLRLVLLSGLGVRLTGLGKVAAELTAGFLAARRDRTASSFRFGRTIGGRWDEGEVLIPGDARPVRAGLRLFGSLLGIVPDSGDPAVVPYGEMRGVAFDASTYHVVVEALDRAPWRIGRLAKRTMPFLEELKQARLALVASYQAQLE